MNEHIFFILESCTSICARKSANCDCRFAITTVDSFWLLVVAEAVAIGVGLGLGVAVALGVGVVGVGEGEGLGGVYPA